MAGIVDNVDDLIGRAIEKQSRGNLLEASVLFTKTLKLQPSNAVALYSLAAIELNQGNVTQGLALAQRCLDAAPASHLSAYIYGAALKANRRLDEALASFDRALTLNPTYVDALIEKGNIYVEKKDYFQSLAQFEKVLTIDPTHVLAQRNRAGLLEGLKGHVQDLSQMTLRGLELQGAGDIAGAQEIFLQILRTQETHFVSLYSLAAMCLNQGRVDEGLHYAELSMKSDPTSCYGWYITGCALKAARRFHDAIKHLDHALTLNPVYKEALMEKGIVYGELKEYVQALLQFNQILQIDPESKLALVNLATSLTILKRHDEGSQFFARLLSIDPEHEYALGAMVHARLHSCNWTDYDVNCQRIIQGVRDGKRVCRSLAFLAISDSPKDQLDCSRMFMTQAYPLKEEQLWKGERYNHTKIRIGYLSPDLREHPVGHLMAGVFEAHDKTRYEIHSFSLGVNDNSVLRKRFIDASEQFVDVRGKASREIAQIIRNAEIDILVDLAGPTMDAQPDILGFRPAPIQVAYLGYPGTSATPYVDFILGDETVTPEKDWPFYTEKVINLPGCYLPTDSKVKIADRTPTRAEMSLPEEGFVFCSFNHDYKISPSVFNSWMNMLKRVEKSVLWLMKLNEAAEGNLRKEAIARGVDPNRLIFATRVPAIEDHLARYRLAGIFLDTTPYNAHTTASDALRSGLPVVTITGHSFQSRVATSILNTIGMPHLSKATLQEYEDFAVEMALNPDRLSALKAELNEKIATAPIYDTVLTTRRIESAYDKMLSW